MTHEDIDKESVRERQSRVVKAGGGWEDYVMSFLNNNLKGTGIEVIIGKNESAVKKRSQVLWERLSIPTKTSTIQSSIWGDIDLVAIKNDLPITIISCKLSLHGRFTETLFWSLLFRILTHTKVVLVTPDAGRGKPPKWESEWGTPDEPTKDRLLAETYLDGVYVDNLETYCKYIKPGEGTIKGGIVRPLDELPSDIMRWEKDISRFVHTQGRGGLERFY